MRLNEVWEGAVESTLNSISEVHYRLFDMPDQVMGTFARLFNKSTGREVAVIFVNKRMPQHWQEFVAIKETMHCWSPMTSYVSGAQQISDLLQGHITKVGSYAIAPIIAADVGGIAAAAEVMLPTASIAPMLTGAIDYQELANRHGLHVDLVTQICQFDMLRVRANGSL